MLMKRFNFKAVSFSFVFVASIYLVITYYELEALRETDCSDLDDLAPDFVTINAILKVLGTYVYVIDKCVISAANNSFSDYDCVKCSKKYYRFGMDHRFVNSIHSGEGTKVFIAAGFDVEIFYHEMPSKQLSEFGSHLPVALILKKSFTYLFHVFYPREDNSWWIGSLSSDNQCDLKIKKLAILHSNCNDWHESVFSKFHFTKKKIIQKTLSNFLLPNDGAKFFNDLKNSYFIECNSTRAEMFKKMYGKRITSEDQRFKHKAWKLLSKTKTILDLLSVKFWLSSGTCLGYFRECDIISYSKDVDIGVFARDFNETIIKHMELHGLKLKHRFGLVNDSLELSFIDVSGVKLDIFFFYNEGDYVWNGGTQLKTRKKFKYIFPKFDLCWTIFRGLRVRVPCPTEEYIIANYGSSWFIPIEKWDWKRSPNNVHFNGHWPALVSLSSPT